MVSLLPCRRTLEQHAIRVNNQVAMWKRSHILNPEIPNPTSRGWKCLMDYYRCFDGSEHPDQLEDIVGRNDDSGDNENDTKFDAESDTGSDVAELFIDSDDD